MKIPSITKLPKYKRFEFQPRYYDPVKEEIAQKMKEAQMELEAEQNGEYEGHSKRMRAGFRKRSTIERQKTDFSQSFFVLCFSSFFILYYKYGNLAFWMLAIMFPLYLWLKLRR
jgi:hypothetical protein